MLTHFDNGQLTAGYDALGRRKWKESGGVRTCYVYDGETPVLECDAFGAVVAVNVFGANGLISRTTYEEGSEASVLIYLFDPLGNVVHRVDPTGAVLSNDLYDAWGNLLASEDPNGNPYPGGDPYGYKGQYGYYTDEETGLILCTYRYYDPAMGRWVTRDAAGYEGGINLYQYCEEEILMSYKVMSIYIDEESNYIVVSHGYSEKYFTLELTRYIVLSSNSTCDKLVETINGALDEFGKEIADDNLRRRSAIEIYRGERSYRKATEGVKLVSVRYTDDEGYIIEPWERNRRGGYDGMPESNIILGHSPSSSEFCDALQQAITLSA